ncbi:MAG: alpha/beta hydrolase [Proteobacteria bacterium]|nr:alpha/beta hydrolase [Burkholderiales bacterium]
MTDKVFLDLDQKALDDAYDQQVWAPNSKLVNARLAVLSEQVRARVGAPLRAAYGPTEVEQLDVYRTQAPDAPVMIYIHGGAWKGHLARDHAYPGEMLTRAGAHLVVPDFAPVQDVGASLLPMVDQVRRAVKWTYQNAATFGGNAKRLYVCGRSSGAHLSACAAITDWPHAFDLPADVVKGYVFQSGMYDLRGPRLSKRGQYVNFTDEMEDALSPMRHVERINAPVSMMVGTLESPEFQRQSRDFAQALADAGKPVVFEIAEGYNHFEIAETAANPFGVVGRALLAMLGLQPR